MGYNFEDDYQTFFPFREMLMKLLTPTPPPKKKQQCAPCAERKNGPKQRLITMGELHQ